jgi:hypothetical protein
MLRTAPKFEQLPQGESTTVNGTLIENMRHRNSKDAAGNELPHKFDIVDLSQIEPGDKVILVIDGAPFRLVKQPSENEGHAEESWSIFRNGKSMGETAFTLILEEDGFSLNNVTVTAGRTVVTYSDPYEDASRRRFRTLGPERKPGTDNTSSSGIASDIYVLASAHENREIKAA